MIQCGQAAQPPPTTISSFSSCNHTPSPPTTIQPTALQTTHPTDQPPGAQKTGCADAPNKSASAHASAAPDSCVPSKSVPRNAITPRPVAGSTNTTACIPPPSGSASMGSRTQPLPTVAFDSDALKNDPCVDVYDNTVARTSGALHVACKGSVPCIALGSVACTHTCVDLQYMAEHQQVPQRNGAVHSTSGALPSPPRAV
jgi:hypothetical protein